MKLSATTLPPNATGKMKTDLSSHPSPPPEMGGAVSGSVVASGADERRRYPRIEDCEEIKADRIYDVPHVVKKNSSFLWPRFIPIIGPKHEDSEIIGFNHEHWHVDWRFVSGGFLELVTIRMISGEHSALARPIITSNIDLEKGIVRKSKRCMRDMLVFPSELAPWKDRLQDRYMHSSAKCGVCPHRGIPLAGAPVIRGARVCPGHGLAWNVKTGELQRR